MNDWKPISEAPKSSDVIVWYEGDWALAFWSLMDLGWCLVEGYELMDPQPTHYMIPEPPTA